MSRRTTSQRRQVIRSLEDKEYRDLYVEEHIDQGLAFQIRATRDERGWTQAQLASLIGSRQSAISKLEDPDYGRPSLTTLKKLASAFDVALVVRFVPFSDLLNHMSTLTADHLAPVDFNRDAVLLVDALPATDTTTVAPIAVSSTGTHRTLPASSGQLPFDLVGVRVIPIDLATRGNSTPSIARDIEPQAVGGYRR